MTRRVRLAFLLILVSGLWGRPAPAAEEPVAAFTVEPRAEGVELSFPAVAGDLPRAVVRGGRLVLDFGRRPPPPLDGLEDRLQAFVAGVTGEPGSGRVFLLLRSGTEAGITREEGARLRISFRRTDAALASVGVRVGRHPDFLRVVFEGPEAAAAEVVRHGSSLELRFARPLDRRVADRVARLPPLDAAEALGDAGIRLRLAEGHDASLMRLPPDRLVIDLAGTKPETETAAVTEDVSESDRAATESGADGREEPADTPAAAETATGTGDETAAPSIVAHGPPSGTPGSSAARPFEGGPPATFERGAETAEAEVLEIRAAREGDTVVMRFLWPFEVGAAAFLRAGRLWLVFDARSRSLLAERKKIAFHAGDLVRSLRKEAHERATVFRIELRRAVELSLRREGPAWLLVFGRSDRSEIPIVAETPPGRLVFPGARREIRFRDSVAGEDIRVFTYARAASGLAEGRRLVDLLLLPSIQGVAWRSPVPEVEASPVPGGMAITRPGGLRLDTEATADREAAAPATSATAPADGKSVPEDAVPATTADTGAPVAFPVPGEEQPAATPEPRETVRETAPSPPDRELHATVDEPSPRPGGSVPGGGGTGAGPATAVAEPDWTTTLGLAELSPEVLRRTARLRRALTAELAMREDPGRQELRLRIARLYLADALGAEAFAQLLATSGSPMIEDDRLLAKRRAALAGASSLLLGRDGVAAEHLRNPLLEDDRETALWRAVLAARENRWGEAAEELERSRNILESYPSALRFRLGMMAVMIAAQNGDAGGAFGWLDRLRELELTDRQRDELRFVEALTLNRDGATSEARRLLARLAEEADWPTATKADYALVNIDRETGLLDEAAARDAFLRQRPFWRGHPWEPTMLRELGRLERALDRIPAALAVWRELLGRYPEAAASRGLPEEMAEALAVALDPEADTPLPLFVRLELYRRYVALVPPGETGDRITLDLARGMLEAGLPEVAETLAAERLKVVAATPLRRDFLRLRARAGLERGALRTARALATALVAAEGDTVEGRLFAARVELARGNPWGALAGVEGIADPRALALRVDAAWLARDWELLAGLADALLADLARRPRLAEEEAVRALQVGTALWRRGERRRVAEIARLVAERDPSLTVETLFELMTTPVTVAGDPRQVIGTAGELADRLRTRLAHLQAGDTGAPAEAAAGL